MASESSFDIVSKVDRQEADNALNQAAKEINSRYDFRGTDASIAWSGEAVQMKANSEDRVKAILDVFQAHGHTEVAPFISKTRFALAQAACHRWTPRAFTQGVPVRST